MYLVPNECTVKLMQLPIHHLYDTSTFIIMHQFVLSIIWPGCVFLLLLFNSISQGDLL